MLKSIKSKLSRNQIVVIVAIIIGFATGVLAVLLKYMVHNIQIILQSDWKLVGQSYLIAIFPMFGILLTVAIVDHCRG